MITIPVPIDASQSSPPVPAISTEVVLSFNIVLPTKESIIIDNALATPVTENVNIILARSTLLPINSTIDSIESLFPKTVHLLPTPISTHAIVTV